MVDFKKEKGFTLIEMLTVLGAMALLIAFSLFISLSDYRSGAFRAERDRLVTVLQTVRADALNNIDEQPHGVAIEPQDHPKSYVEFEGLTYHPNSGKDIIIDMQYPPNFSSDSPKEVIFYQLSGNTYDSVGVPFDGDIKMIDPQRGISFTISLNHEGRISW